MYYNKAEQERAATLRELAELIAAGIDARREAKSEHERTRWNRILTRAYNKKYELMRGGVR